LAARRFKVLADKRQGFKEMLRVQSIEFSSEEETAKTGRAVARLAPTDQVNKWLVPMFEISAHLRKQGQVVRLAVCERVARQWLIAFQEQADTWSRSAFWAYRIWQGPRASVEDFKEEYEAELQGQSEARLEL
jgi:hypothetical protein